MDANCDVLIVGGAVTGAATAWWLLGQRPGLRVVVAEKDPTYARAATALSVASVRQQFSNPVNVKISRFGVDFIRNFSEMIGPEGGVPSLGLKENGYLFLTGSDIGRGLLEELAAMQRSLGAATEVLDRAALAARFPWMRLDDVLAGSIGTRDEGWFDNMGLLNGFRAAARARGARFLADRVVGLDREGGRITGARLAEAGRIGVGAVLCAAGTGSAEVCRMAAIALPVRQDVEVIALVYIGSATEGALQAHAETRLAPYKRPRLYLHRDALPTTANGKINRRALRKEWKASQ